MSIAHLCVSSGLTFLFWTIASRFEFAISIGEDFLFWPQQHVSRGDVSDRSEQGEVWREVACLHASHKVSSSTTAMSDCFDTYRDRIADFRERLQYVDGATGMAVAVGGRIASVDVFDKPETCQKVWDRLLSGDVFDALEAGKAAKPAEVASVKRLLENSRGRSWEPTEAVGEGEEYRPRPRKAIMRRHWCSTASRSTEVCWPCNAHRRAGNKGLSLP
jgi:hypothetical protein